MRPPEVVTLDFFGRRKYVVARTLQGGMGSVHQLVPIDSADTIVALKTIQGTASIQAFDSECDAWFSVAHHPNIARAFAFGTWKSMPGVVVEWYPRSLDAVDSARLSASQLLALFRGVIDALDYAYTEVGLIHQDIKPANVLVDGSGTPRLSDFGLARCVASRRTMQHYAGPNSVRERATSIGGTPFYMAPELWDGMRPSIRTDIYSLGVTLYQFLTGHHPYIEDLNKPIFRDTLQLTPLQRALSGRGEDIQAIEELVTRCLKLDPEERFSSYKEMDSYVPKGNRTQTSQNWTLERSRIVAGASQFYTIRGVTKKAIEVLERPLRERPDDPVLLNALAQVQYEQGSKEKADALLAQCYRMLKASSGMYEGTFVPDPALGRARLLIANNQFAQACDLISEVSAWAGHRDEGQEPLPRLHSHPEVGWRMLFKRDFRRAADFLARYAEQHSLTKDQLIWLTEASWLADVIVQRADEIALKALCFDVDVFPKRGELEFAWCRFLLRHYANPLLCERLWKGSPSYLFGESNKLETQHGLKAGSLLVSKSREAQIPIMILVDEYVTGGKHNEHIRSLRVS